MSVPKWLKVPHQQVFPHRAFLVSDVTAVIDYERSTKDNKVQATDRESGQPLWQVEVLDGDPAASKRARTVTVKFVTPKQPVCPTNESGMPFTPVVFEELSVLPYVDRSGESGRIAWSFRAASMTADTGKAGSSAPGRASA
ncbi:plasmid replication, integration and excision activator [Mycobacterium alsense]|uniref:Plasmid replication, integration and excision activator n=1 Tax=Mycobacterium alsense TaxID=324058 RepID=A0AA42BWY6_9MYCO|nr:plasmid replication, integration and excision activator [Mycobacterium alsense]MCV7377649.1 plasmid replication, integration and excision activator [Mycobacterium alsense]OQZ93017.1 plasmid replication, integration and excision activator [Mycobacterium alsense]